MASKYLCLPVRRSLDGVSWASLSVQWVPTVTQIERRREGFPLSLLRPRKERKEKRPALHPLDDRRFPFERLYFRLDRGSKRSWPGAILQTANIGGFKSKPVAVSSVAGSA